MTYAFTQGSFLLLLLVLPLHLQAHISEPISPYPSLEAKIPVFRSKSRSQGPNPILKPKSFLGSGPEGADDLCFHTGEISPPSPPPSPPPSSPYPPLEAQIPASRIKSQPGGSNPSLEDQISACRLKSQPRGSNPSLASQIPASRLKSQP